MITFKSIGEISERFLRRSMENMKRDMEGWNFYRKCIERGGRMKLTPLGGIGNYQGTLIQFIPDLPPFPCGVFRYERPGVIVR